MKAYLIDPNAPVLVSEINFSGGLDEIYRLLDVHAIDAVRLPNGDAIYIDDEGALFDREELERRGLFGVVSQDFQRYSPYCGKGLLVGTTGDGNDAPPKMSLVFAQTIIRPVPVHLRPGLYDKIERMYA